MIIDSMDHSTFCSKMSSLSTPVFYSNSISTSGSDSGRSSSVDPDDSPVASTHFKIQETQFKLPGQPLSSESNPYRLLGVLPDHVGSVSCLALCGEFLLSASHGKDIIVWQQPDLRQFTRFGQGEGSVKAMVTVGNRVFTAHQDSRIRVWKVSRSSENAIRLVNTLPTAKDYIGKFMKQSNYVQTRRHHKNLWIEHVDSISCLAVSNGLIYSGSWDRTLKVWRISTLKCLESIRAHDDAINGLVASHGFVYSASADGKIKIWSNSNSKTHTLKGTLTVHKDVSVNCVIVSQENEVVYGGGSDGYLMGWKREQKQEKWVSICEVKAHEMAILCVCLVGEFMCSGSADKSICVWKRDTQGEIFRVGVVRGHEGPIKCLQAWPNWVGGGFLLYSGSLDKSLRVWWVNRDIRDTENCTCPSFALLCK